MLLLMRAGLSALPRPPGVKLSRAPPGVNWEDISPGLSPAAAAAIAAKLAPGNWDSPGAATITWPVPKVAASDVGTWLRMVCA